MQALIEAAPLAIVALDLEFNVTLWNPAAERMFGWTGQEVLGHRYPLAPKKHWDQVVSSMRQLSSDITLDREERVREHKTGRLIDVSVSTAPLLDDDGRLVGLMAIYADVTERKRTREELKFANAVLRTQQETCPDGILVVSETGRIVSFNQRFAELWSLSADVLKSRTNGPVFLAVLNKLSDPAQFLSREQYLQQHREELSRDELQLVDGRTFERYSAPMLAPEGNYYGRIWYFRDISERKRAEEERAAILAQLYQAQKLDGLGQLAGGVAHDFHNLLTVILGNLDILKKLLPDNPPVVETAAMIKDAAEQAVGLTRSLLTFSRRLPIEKKGLLLQTIVTDAARMLRRLLPACVPVVVDVPPIPPIYVQADPNQLQQVLLNLAINARDAMPHGGTLTLAAFLREPQLSDEFGMCACVSVSDTGEGIPESVRPHLFEPFFSTKPREQGTGLGLAIVHGIVADHGGRIEVDSQVGKGSSFRVLLPCCEADTAHTLEPTPEKAPPGRQETIAVVDDDSFVRAVIASTLRDLNYQVLDAADGLSILSTWHNLGNRIHLLILDVDLPELRGIDCLRLIRRAGSRIPVILITGVPDPRLEDGIDTRTLVLQKPFTATQLGVLVDRMLAQYGEPNHG